MERRRYRAVRSPLRRGASIRKGLNRFDPENQRFSLVFFVFLAFSKNKFCALQMDRISVLGALTQIWTGGWGSKRVRFVPLQTIISQL